MSLLIWAKNCMTQALRPKGMEQLPAQERCRHLGTSCCALPAVSTCTELMTDIGLGKRIASIVAKRLVLLLSRWPSADAIAVHARAL